MRCIEVGELMQRKLDLDLTELETMQLEAHLSTCESCKILFERLSLLSSHLEQLPRVTPSFSIVDSILPQLAEIDKQHEQAAALYNNEVSESVSPLKSKTLLNRLNKKSIVAATSSLVAAAAILLTIGLNNAEKLSQSTANNQADMTAFIVEERASVETTMRSGDMRKDVSVIDQSGEEKLDAFANTSEPTSSMAVDHFKSTQEADKDFGAATSSGFQYEGAVESGGSVAEAPVSNRNDVVDSSSVLGHSFGFMSEEDFTRSPDERFYLQFDEHTIIIHDFNTKKTIKTIEVPIEGDINFIGWHENAIEFYVEVIDKHQRTHPLTFSVGQ